jgi:predicted small secreted protein
MAGGSALKAFRRNLFAVLVAAFLLSACTDNGSTGGGQGATDRPTSSPTTQPTVEPGRSPGTSPTTSPSTTSPSQSTSSPKADRLCDTKIESANPALRNVRFGRHDTYDRLAFDFCKPAETTLTATVVRQLTEDGSGAKVTLQGKYFIAITLTPADAHSDAGRPTVPNHAVTVAGRNMQQYKLIGDFEGVVTYGVGVRRLEETATAIRSDPNDPRHIILYFDLGPQSG